MKKRVLCAIIFLLAAGVQAEVISLNFVGNAGAAGTLASTDIAGLTGSETGSTVGNTMVSNWNNLTGANNSAGVGGLTDSSGAVLDGVSVAWSGAQWAWSLPNTTGGANTSDNTKMMKGLIDSNGEISMTLSGLTPVSGSYSVIVYVDGDQGANTWRNSGYSINGEAPVRIEDSEWVDFNSGGGNNANGLFQMPVAGGTIGADWPTSPNNEEGNMIIFSGLTGDSFTLTGEGNAASSGGLYAPINGIQVVGVIPEPAVMGLVGVFGGGLLIVRRFFMV